LRQVHSLSAVHTTVVEIRVSPPARVFQRKIASGVLGVVPFQSPTYPEILYRAVGDSSDHTF